jgi:hypothetical protein
MVLRQFKIPRHGGPDGQGLPRSVFEELLKIFNDSAVSDQDAESAMLLSFSASTTEEWNEEYRPQLQSLCIDNAKK